MIISHQHKFIFVKTKKTAGSTLENLLYPHLGPDDICTGSERDGTPAKNIQPNTNGHLIWDQIQSKYPKEWKSYYKFSIERNPWDKVVSSYSWHQKIKSEYYGDMPFEKYVLTCSLLPLDWGAYAQNDELQVNRVFMYEDMGAMYATFNDKFGIDIPKEMWYNTRLKSGIRTNKDYHDMHTPATIQHVAELYAKEIKLLGYTYE